MGGGTGHVIEYAGAAVRALSMERRMTLCNMSIEAGARAGLVAPDETTFDYLAGRPAAPAGRRWDAAVRQWRSLATEDGARFDREVAIECGDIAPMITFGTNPGMAIRIDAEVPATRVGRHSRRAASARPGARLHADRTGQAAARPPGGRRLHRQLHERAVCPTCAKPPPSSGDAGWRRA